MRALTPGPSLTSPREVVGRGELNPYVGRSAQGRAWDRGWHGSMNGESGQANPYRMASYYRAWKKGWLAALDVRAGKSPRASSVTP